ncbi:hypothetical protein [Streptomyces lacrimifluminis]|uniref:hypothetical protein n=1 Tax=Streptomyces lacrimifluminis TaxID=1500077 RepID=UPI00166912F5|nr:hypothetical protein [Streptomyces lacrimifluminis]
MPRDTITAWCERVQPRPDVRRPAYPPQHVVHRLNRTEQLTGHPLREHRTVTARCLACPAEEPGEGATPDEG